MTIDKRVNPAQLNDEAKALAGSTHVALTLVGPPPGADGIYAAGSAGLFCVDIAGDSAVHEPCSFCATAYAAHAAVANPAPPPTPQEALTQALATATDFASFKTALTGLLGS